MVIHIRGRDRTRLENYRENPLKIQVIEKIDEFKQRRFAKM